MKYTIALIIIFVTVAGFIEHQGLAALRAEESISEKSGNIARDLEQLAGLPAEFQLNDTVITLRYSSAFGSFESREEFERIGLRVSSLMQLPAGKIHLDAENHLVYETAANTVSNIHTALRLIGVEQHRKAYLLITMSKDMSSLSYDQADAETEPLKAAPIDELNELLYQQEKISSVLKKELELTNKWNIIVQGNLANEAPVWGLVTNRLNAKEVERYSDVNTTSVSYFSPTLHNSIMSGDRQINLQVAVHRHTVTNEWRITIGTPIITTEY
jgi:hypothetical protein